MSESLSMGRIFLVVCGLGLLASVASAAPQCVDPNLCPEVVCPPGYDFVDTTCKECAHCEKRKGGKGKRPPGEDPIASRLDAPDITLPAASPEECDETAASLVGLDEGGVMVAGKRRGCKPCSKDRRWCECSYNGVPRISCDPCCYDDDSTPLPICLD